ncbi:sugar phosphate isomerase/epimerase family protein [Thiomicrorhabdus heinhorstiae]|uniref:Sugar phosphate isomerase/epimerase n=1 Tax=Thiomicrorhabdus heinhorstiae TaxID=2748010 RepID=A0ABS0BXQ8_9GAMM|nr:sugar phosphate isomerase/epimerase [Thiomicrorhabdus heinhorstiae]MBF6057860.1 sugar phosphate isomerase/epimerase [Thiomicrorhabdus heinhorstiae]
MRLKTFKTLWGNTLPIESACAQAKFAGFDGIEGRAPSVKRQAQWQETLQIHQCDYIAEIVTGNDYVPDRSWTIPQHLDDIKRQIEKSQPLSPLFATCIVGCDAWSESEAIVFFEHAMRLEEEFGLLLSFETHRSRPTFNPWSTLRIAEALPELKLTADISHWCVVCERLMDSEMETLQQLIPQIYHIHARVGYDQGPQVPDPRAPEYQTAVDSHLNFWQQIWQYKHRHTADEISMTPEFGPDGYCHLQPYTQMPVVDLWEVNQWMNKRVRQAYSDCLDAL